MRAGKLESKRPPLATLEKISPSPRSVNPLFVRSVEKALKILSIFDNSRPSMSISQIAAASGLDRSAAQRFTYTLESLGYLARNADTKRYALTVKTLDVGYAYMRSTAIIEHSTPFLLHLSHKIREGVNLSVLDGTEVVIVARISSKHLINSNPSIGTRLPAYCTAAGIAILSKLPRVTAERILGASVLQKLTDRTTNEIPDLLRKLDEAATQGYAALFEERQLNDISIAAAVLDPNGQPAAAVTIALSKLDYTFEKATQQFAALARATAGAISGRD